MDDRTFIPRNNAESRAIEKEPSWELISTQEYLGFKSVEVTAVDEADPRKPPTKVKVTKENGEIVEIDAGTPFFVLRNKDGRELIVSAATAGHIDSLHIKGTDTGSLFDEPSLEALMRDASKKIPADIATRPGVSVFDIEMGKNMGQEGIAGLEELQESEILTREDIRKALVLKGEVARLNRVGTKDEKRSFIDNHTDEKIKFQLIRSDVLVPVVDAPKRPTTKLFMVFGPTEKGDRKTLYTMAPGRSMPMHPNPKEHMNADGMVNEQTFQESADSWFYTVMLTGKDKTGQDISMEAKRDDPNVLELKNLVNSTEFRVNFLAVQTRAETAQKNKLLNSRRKKNYEEKFAEANTALLQATEIQMRNLDQLKKELEQPTPQLIEALNVWGRSRNVRGEYGPDQKGFNAGVVHYFEYRAHVRKNKKRFKPEYTLSTDGFIAHTKQYKSFLENPNPVSNPQIETARLLEDSKGNRRLYVLTKEKEFIVGFERAGEGMKILSVFLEQNTQKLNKAADDELNSTEKSQTRFNRLEGHIKEISL